MYCLQTAQHPLEHILMSILKSVLPQSYRDLSDKELMQKLNNGEKKAFNELFNRYGSLVLGYSRQIVGNKEKAEDLSQEVWVKLIKASSSYQEQGSFKSWLLTITRNTALSELRITVKQESIDDPESFLNDCPSQQDTLDELLEKHIEEEKLIQAIQQLPDEQRAALLIWMTEDLSYSEIADQLSVSLAQVKNLIFRAKQNIIGKVGVSV